MCKKEEEYKKLKEQVKYYKELAGTHLVTINEKEAEIENLKEKIKRLEAQIANNTSNLKNE